MSAQGQIRKMRACLLHVRFTPLSGRMLRRVLSSALGQQTALPWAVWYGRREEALTCENPIFYGLSSVLLHAMCSRGVQQVKASSPCRDQYGGAM